MSDSTLEWNMSSEIEESVLKLALFFVVAETKSSAFVTKVLYIEFIIIYLLSFLNFTFFWILNCLMKKLLDTTVHSILSNEIMDTCALLHKKSAS